MTATDSVRTAATSVELSRMTKAETWRMPK